MSSTTWSSRRCSTATCAGTGRERRGVALAVLGAAALLLAACGESRRPQHFLELRNQFRLAGFQLHGEGNRYKVRNATITFEVDLWFRRPGESREEFGNRLWRIDDPDLRLGDRVRYAYLVHEDTLRTGNFSGGRRRGRLEFEKALAILEEN